CRQGISWPQRTRPAPRLHLRPKARRVRRHQTRAQTTIRHRTPHRPHEGRGSSRPLLPQGPCRRRRQRHTDRRRPQLPPHPRLAEEAVALNLPRSVDRPNRPTNLQSGFLTANYPRNAMTGRNWAATGLVLSFFQLANVSCRSSATTASAGPRTGTSGNEPDPRGEVVKRGLTSSTKRP